MPSLHSMAHLRAAHTAESTFLRLFEIHVKLALDHAVVELAAFVRPAAEKGFKILVGTDDIIAKFLLAGKHLPHLPVEGLGFLYIQQPFPIGRVAAVSYTHLDVYKRQQWYNAAHCQARKG